MLSGPAAQDFSPVSNVNYQQAVNNKQGALQVGLNAQLMETARVEQRIKEAEANRMLNAQAQSTIGAILGNNQNLLKSIDSGDAPESVQNAYKKYEKGSGSVESNALLSNWAVLSNQTQKENEALEFEQQRQTMSDLSSFNDSQARVIKAQTEASKLKPLTIPSDTAQQFLADNPNAKLSPMEGGITRVDSLGGTGSSGESKLSGWMSNKEIKAYEDQTGLKYARYPEKKIIDGVEIMGAKLGKSYAPSEAATLMPFEEKTAIGFQEAAKDWNTGSKRKIAVDNLNVYKDAVNKLGSGATLTGTTFEKINGILGLIGLDDPMRAWFNPEGADLLENIRGVVFQGLRDTLGAQFTEKEGIRLVNATYNTSLSPRANVMRLKRLAKLLEDSIEYKDRLSELSLTRDGVISLVTQGGARTKNWLNTQIDIMEQEFNQADLLYGDGGDLDVSGGTTSKIDLPDDVSALVNKYGNQNL